MLSTIDNFKFTIAFAASLIIIILLIIVNSLLQRVIMANNIDNAIEKGIDPITVRCAYAQATDNVCLAYAITHKPLEAPEAPVKKK